ncbi:hypothetical protein KW784_00405 [Candidatus Parcubacteria bacterium]|nr:hypothetical protein [Candidatus Parcubacteria bacterium]
MKGKDGKMAEKSYLVEAVLLAKLPFQGPLSYFSGTRLAPGSLVNVPVRNRLSPALVLSSKGVRSAKAEIRKALFALRKIRKSDILEASLAAAALEALKDVASHYAAPLGVLATSLLPALMRQDPETFLKPEDAGKRRSLESASRETILLQMEGEERFGQYRALVRSSFARDASAILVVPTHLDVEKAKSELSTGIAEFVHAFTLEERPAEAARAWQKALGEPHPVLFITTPAGLFFPRADVDTLIVERANSRAYRTLSRPYIDLRFLAEKLAKRREWKLVMGDAVLPVETLWRERAGEFGEMSLVRWRLPAAPARIVDASIRQDGEGRFEIFSKELKEMIAKALDEKAPVFLFGVRKGLAPTTVCGDCGAVLPCKNCGAPVVLHRKDDATIYACHACGATRESLVACGICGGWRLVPLGIGTEEIARQARALWPAAEVAILDKDHAPSDAKARAIAERFEKKGGILVGTELAFFHLGKVPYAAAVSVDALFSVPDFHANERIFYLMSRLRETAASEVLIQTRRGTSGNQVLAWAAQGNIIDFYQAEIADREALLYPPFSVFVKIAAQDPAEAGGLRERLAKWSPDAYKGSVILRVPRAAWPDPEIARELALLGPAFSIKVDPESIL